MTDAHGASCAVWPRSLHRSPPEQAKATGKWRDNIRRGGSRASQREQRETGRSHRPLRGGTSWPKRRSQGTPPVRLRERDRKRQCLDLSSSGTPVGHCLQGHPAGSGEVSGNDAFVAHECGTPAPGPAAGVIDSGIMAVSPPCSYRPAPAKRGPLTKDFLPRCIRTPVKPLR